MLPMGEGGEVAGVGKAQTWVYYGLENTVCKILYFWKLVQLVHMFILYKQVGVKLTNLRVPCQNRTAV